MLVFATRVLCADRLVGGLGNVKLPRNGYSCEARWRPVDGCGAACVKKGDGIECDSLISFCAGRIAVRPASAGAD
jgi:hypothetical protein